MIDLQALTYLAFGMAFLSLWIHKSAWLWGSFLVIALSLALQTKTIDPFALIPIVTLLLIQFWFKKGVAGLQRWVAFGIAAFISTALIFHWIPGFHNWKITNHFWINFDAPFAGFFVLALNLPLLRSRAQWSEMALKTIPLVVLGIGLMIGLAMLAGPVSWQPKWPSHLFLRLASNLILVSAAEEGFFRGFVQEELFNRFGKGAKGHIGAVVLTSIFFTLCHVKWTASFSLLGFVFLAGLLYGSIYQYTKMIESSILCHFTLNFVHMLFFTYHAM
ncbi:MAG: CPBP family intramembrane metalloprotease [Verrucomicrobia bacterium]|nr:CPBP family intramembrane metalloprotease [Verrucomicrobiota bacterium]